MSQKSTSLLVVLAVLVLAALAQYTAGGGWHTVSNEVDHEARLKAAELPSHDPIKLPGPMGRKDAPARFDFYIEGCTCLQGNVTQIVNAFWSMQDRAYVTFQPPTPDMKPRPARGILPACETIARINGLATLRVPWLDRPEISHGKGAGGITDAEYKRLVDWLSSPEGQASVKRQLAAQNSPRK